MQLINTDFGDLTDAEKAKQEATLRRRGSVIVDTFSNNYTLVDMLSVNTTHRVAA